SSPSSLPSYSSLLELHSFPTRRSSDLLCRASLAEHLDADEIVEVTRQGMDFYDEHFDYPYPFGKYDQVFVPEYNLGAMENPGCVDRKSTRLNSSHVKISYAVFCLKKKK